MIKLTILTRCSRLNNLKKVRDSIFTTQKFDITWRVMFDTTVLKDIDAELLASIHEKNGVTYFINSIPGDFGHQMLNKSIEDTKDGFLYILDDDNIIHEDFYDNLYDVIVNNMDKRGFVFHQKIGGKDFTGLDIRLALPENMKISGVDSAQYVLRRDLIGDIRLVPMNYIADSIFAEGVYMRNPNDFFFIDKVMCYYNQLQPKNGARVPKILYIGEGKPDLKSIKRAWWESDELELFYRENDFDLVKDIREINPDFIVSVGDKNKNQNLINSPLDIKKRWINLDKYTEPAGEIAYNSSMNYILDNDGKDLVSFFTPIYNTGDKLQRLYDSISKQTYTNWEWVIVNDSSDGGKTLKLAEKIAESDHRVKIYDFREKSKGIIGESKYRCAVLCRGDILIEIDHDDYILPDSAKVVVEAFKKFPDAGFAYTDCVEILEDWSTTLTYPPGFCFGYGKYRKEREMGIVMNVNISPNINPKTIRHIVGIPNHIRAWKRDVYFKVGGHNRRLSIADDYELVIRTFLETKFVRILKNCYLQFIYRSEMASNTHELSRADIQRRVRSIMDYYNYDIHKRFEELGVEDWAYLNNRANPLMVPSRFGDEEGSVNYNYYPDGIENEDAPNNNVIFEENS